MRRPIALLFATVLILPGCASFDPAVARTCVHENASVENAIGYCQALRVGRTLYVSGVAGQGEMPDAVRSVYQRLQLTLEANGLSFANVVKENVYAKDLDAFIRANEVRKPFYQARYPAATWVQVQRLYSASFVVEVELVAEYPN